MKYGVSHKDDPDEYRTRQSQALRRLHPVRYLLRQAKHRAKSKGLEFNVEFEDIVIPDVCPVFGIPLFFSPGRRTANSYSLDRWDNTKGYTKENTRVISWKANQYKGDLSIDEVKNLLAYMTGQEK